MKVGVCLFHIACTQMQSEETVLLTSMLDELSKVEEELAEIVTKYPT